MHLVRFAGAVLTGWLMVQLAQAATITVDTTTDQFNNSTPCSIREALDSVRLGANGRGCTATGTYGTNDTIILPAGTYTLTLTGGEGRGTLDLDVERAVTLQGAGGNPSGTIIDASGLGAVQSNTNVIEVLAGVTAVFNDIQLQGGKTNTAYRGAGVQNAGTLTLMRCAVVNNTGSASAAGGTGNSGTFSIDRSYLGGNTNADVAVGAGSDNNGGVMTIVNSTYGGNSTAGAAVYHYNDGSASMAVSYSTFEANARALTAESGPLAVSASILNGSCTTAGGSITDSGYNTDSSTGCGLAAPTSQSSTPITLPTAALNGGTTLNYLISAPSAVYNRIPPQPLGCGAAVAVDQRGFVRPAGANCDIGAVEVAYDFGDAPATYGSASHSVPAGLGGPRVYIANVAPDTESASQSSADARGDDTNGTADEGDIFVDVQPGGKILTTVAVLNGTGVQANLCAWLDGEGTGTVNGIFDASEGKCSSVAPGLTGTGFLWTVPNALQIDTYLRVRVTTGPLTEANPIGGAPDGEVEDYFLTILPTRALISRFALERDAATGLPAVVWDTASEQGTLGFYLERWDAGLDQWLRLNTDLLPGLIDAPMGGQYRLIDDGVAEGEAHRYRLIEVEAWGGTNTYGPYEVSVGGAGLRSRARVSLGGRAAPAAASVPAADAQSQGEGTWADWRLLAPGFEGRARQPSAQPRGGHRKHGSPSEVQP